MKILLCDKFSKIFEEKLIKQNFFILKDLKKLDESEIIIVRSKTIVNKEFIDIAKNLKLIIRWGVGLDNIDLNYAKEKNIIVENTEGVSAISVSELVFGHLFNVFRNFQKSYNTMKKGLWIKKELKGFELYGKVLGLIGFGNIGKEVFKRAESFGMKIMIYDISGYKNTNLNDLYKNADIISFHLPLTEKTKNMLNENSIKLMKKGVVIVNTSRGEIVNEDDLIKNLKSKKIKAYAVDVYKNEPYVNKNLIELDNVFPTPHIGAKTVENFKRTEKIVLKKIIDLRKLI